jgi:hypothetical protein
LSITKFRGCFSAAGPPVAILIGVVLVVGFLYNRNGSNRPDASDVRRLGEPAFKVDGFEIYDSELGSYVQQARQQAIDSKRQASGPVELSPSETLRLYQTALQRGLYLGLESVIARKQGIEATEEDVRKSAEESARKSIEQVRSEAEMQQKMYTSIYQSQLDAEKKKDPKSPRIKELEAKLAEIAKQTPDQVLAQRLQGMTPDQYVQRVMQEVEKAMQDPYQRRVQIGVVSYELVRAKYAQAVDTSDKALRDSYDKFTLQEITLTGDDAKTKAEAVLAKIKGGMDFAEAARQFTTRKTPDGKPDISNTFRARFDLMSQAALEPILSLKKGEISGVIEMAGAASLYKLVDIQPDVPKDFDKQKQQRAETMRTTLASAKLAAELEAARKAAAATVEWKDEAWKLAFDWFDLQEGDKGKELLGVQNKPKRVEALKSILERSKSTVGSVADIPPLVRYAALNQLDVEDPAGREARKADLLETYGLLVDIVASTQFRISYVEMLLGSGKGDEALKQLYENVLSAFPPSATTAPIIAEVERYLTKAANYASKDSKTLADIQKELEQWHKDDEEQKAQAKKDEDERKKLEEEQRKANQAELDRQKKEKEAGQKKAAPPSAATPPTTPGTQPKTAPPPGG